MDVVLEHRVTDASLQTLAKAGCGDKLTSLHLCGLGYNVTDSGLRALVEVGCGSKLTSLSLQSNKRITNNNFAASLGLSANFHDEDTFTPQQVYVAWCQHQGVDHDAKPLLAGDLPCASSTVTCQTEKPLQGRESPS